MLTQDLSLGWIFGIGESRFHSGPGGQETQDERTRKEADDSKFKQQES